MEQQPQERLSGIPEDKLEEAFSVHQGAETIDGHLVEVEQPSLLDRSISLESLSWISVGWVVVALAAFLLRVANYTSWPLSASEGRLASDALSLVQGGSVAPSAWSAPLPTTLTALALFLFGNSDGVVRLVPLLAGLGTIALVAWLRPFAGRGFILATAAIIAVSPTLVAASRSANAGALLVFSSLLAFAAGLRWLQQHSTGFAVLFGVAAAMTVMSAPIGWIALPITVVVVALISDERNAPARDIPLMLLGAAVTILVVSTGLFIHPAGFSDFFRESFRALWNQHLTNAGDAWHLAIFQVLIDETLALLLGIAAIVYLFRHDGRVGSSRIFVTGLVLWTALGLLFASLLGGKETTLYTLVALPLALLAGAGLEDLVTRVPWPQYVTPRGALFLVLVPVTFFAGVSTYGLLSSDIGSDTLNWLVTFVLVAIIIFAPLLALTIWLRRSLNGWGAVLTLFVVLLLSGLAIRGSALLGDTINVGPGEPLTIGYSEPAVGLTVSQIRAVSRDMTTFEQDVRDPTGGHGLTIYIDSSIAEPFQWYFRDFPNVRIVDPAQQIPAAQEPQVLIARSDHAGMLASSANRLQRTLPLATTTPVALSNPNFGDLIGSLIHPGRWQRYPEFLVNRQVAQPSDPTHFVLSLRQDVVKQMYGNNPPASNP